MSDAPDLPPVPTGAPDGFVAHTHRHAFKSAHPRAAVWTWLNDPATFTDSQVPPWRVEFLDGGFAPGVLTMHHGPFMVFAGMLGEIRPPEYRDLRYFYGSYAVSQRLVRPTRLQFWVDEHRGADGVPAGSRVTLQVDALVRSWVTGPWDALQSVFWGRFETWMDRALR